MDPSRDTRTTTPMPMVYDPAIEILRICFGDDATDSLHVVRAIHELRRPSPEVVAHGLDQRFPVLGLGRAHVLACVPDPDALFYAAWPYLAPNQYDNVPHHFNNQPTMPPLELVSTGVPALSSRPSNSSVVDTGDVTPDPSLPHRRCDSHLAATGRRRRVASASLDNRGHQCMFSGCTRKAKPFKKPRGYREHLILKHGMNENEAHIKAREVFESHTISSRQPSTMDPIARPDPPEVNESRPAATEDTTRSLVGVGEQFSHRPLSALTTAASTPIIRCDPAPPTPNETQFAIPNQLLSPTGHHTTLQRSTRRLLHPNHPTPFNNLMSDMLIADPSEWALSATLYEQDGSSPFDL